MKIRSLKKKSKITCQHLKMLSYFGREIFIRTPFKLIQKATRREKGKLSVSEGDEAHLLFRCAVLGDAPYQDL